MSSLTRKAFELIDKRKYEKVINLCEKILTFSKTFTKKYGHCYVKFEVLAYNNLFNIATYAKNKNRHDLYLTIMGMGAEYERPILECFNLEFPYTIEKNPEAKHYESYDLNKSDKRLFERCVIGNKEEIEQSIIRGARQYSTAVMILIQNHRYDCIDTIFKHRLVYIKDIINELAIYGSVSIFEKYYDKLAYGKHWGLKGAIRSGDEEVFDYIMSKISQNKENLNLDILCTEIIGACEMGCWGMAGKILDLL